MTTGELSVVTGAFGYTGSYITQRLLANGERVRTLTGHPARPHPFGDKVSAAPLNFDDPSGLREGLRGATTLYNTYWIRFPRGALTFEKAVENSQRLLQAAQAAGVRRIVHLSVVNASAESSLSYFKGKGLVEKALIQSGLSFAILRPTLVFGLGDILLNNIAWLLRRLPMFAIFGSGEYQLQPVYAEDIAQIAVNAGHQQENILVNAAGPEVYTFEEIVRLIALKIGSTARIMHLPPGIALLLSRVMGYVIGDVVLTGDEVEGLMAGLLVSPSPPAGRTRLSDWLDANAHKLGMRYASELDRHYRQSSATGPRPIRPV